MAWWLHEAPTSTVRSGGDAIRRSLHFHQEHPQPIISFTQRVSRQPSLWFSSKRSAAEIRRSPTQQDTQSRLDSANGYMGSHAHCRSGVGASGANVCDSTGLPRLSIRAAPKARLSGCVRHRMQSRRNHPPKPKGTGAVPNSSVLLNPVAQKRGEPCGCHAISKCKGQSRRTEVTS